MVLAALGLLSPGETMSASDKLILTLLLTPIQPLGLVGAAVGYHDLRTGKEGVDVEELVRVFE